MQHRARDAASAHFGVTAHHLARRLRTRNGMAGGEIGPQQERVDSRRVPTQHHVLVRVRKNLRLHEIARREQSGQGGGLARVGDAVGEDVLGAAIEGFAHPRGIDVHAAGRGDVKMPRQLLQPEALELAARDVVVLGQDPGVDDAAAADIVAPIRDRAVGDLQARGAPDQLAPVASQREPHAMTPRASDEIIERVTKQVMALDHVRIALGHRAHQLLDHRTLVHRVAAQNTLVARRIPKRYRDDAVALARRAREFEPATDVGLDRELHPAKLVEFHADEKGHPAEYQMLFDRIAEHEVRRVGDAGCFAGQGAQMTPRGLERVDTVEGRKPAQTKVAGQRRDLVRRAQTVEHPGFGEQGKKRERAALALERGTYTAVDLDLARRGDLDGDDSGLGRITEEQPIVVKLAADLLVAAHRDSTEQL